MLDAVRRIWRIVRGAWNHWVLRRELPAVRLTDIDEEFFSSLKAWELEFRGQPTPPTPTQRYEWRKIKGAAFPTWKLLDTTTDIFLCEVYEFPEGVWRYFNKEYATLNAAVLAAESSHRLFSMVRPRGEN